MRAIHAALLGGLLLPAACATSQTGKPVASAANAAADLTQGGNLLALVSAIYATTPNPNATVEADLAAAQSALSAAAVSLAASGAVTGDLAANVAAVNAALNAAIAGLQTVDPADAAKITAYRAAVLAALRIYNADAPAAGLPVVPVPAS